MPIIELITKIAAPIEVCFDLSRSIDLHIESTSGTNEKAVAGTTGGLIELGATVTWEATHFGIRQRLTSKITEYSRPKHFRDEMIKGAFRSMVHNHCFRQENDITIMKDRFEFHSPLGILGTIADKLVLTNYLTKLLTKRNNVIKEYAESGKWKILNKKQR